MDRFLTRLVRRGLRQGLLGGDNKWLVLGAGALLARFVLKTLKRRPEVVFSEKLPVGGRLVITHAAPRGHNGRGEGPAPQP